MGRSKEIEMPIHKMSPFAQVTLIEAIRKLNEFKGIDPNSIIIFAKKKITHVIEKIDDYVERLNNFISINKCGDRRVTKTKLCNVLRIPRSTLNKWEKYGLVSLMPLGRSIRLLQESIDKLSNYNAQSYALCSFRPSQDDIAKGKVHINRLCAERDRHLKVFRTDNDGLFSLVWDNCGRCKEKTRSKVFNPKSTCIDQLFDWNTCTLAKSLDSGFHNDFLDKGIELQSFLEQLKKYQESLRRAYV
ncbi:MAG: hypothetical protein LBC84_06890 [Prevotellaceae bacterium]|jgi:hypothetical protein|nr:hypothetical protein [Prevotellaceae bacterium]